MRLARRGFILGGSSAVLAGCATTVQQPVGVAVVEPAPQAVIAPPPAPRPALTTAQLRPPPLDPRRLVRPDLMQRALAALDVHSYRIPVRDRMYLVDFSKFSGEPRLYEVDLHGGYVQAVRTSHGRGSDPGHSGYAQTFSNTPESYMSSVGAYATGGADWGSQHGPNVRLDGLEYSNNLARERAIIVHGADYASPEFLAREGKLGRSWGCFSVSHTDLPFLRDRMGQGRLLFAYT